MPRVQISGEVDGCEAREGLALVCDYERWPDLSDAVEAVRVEREDERQSRSFWEVTFRRGLMRWTERDELNLSELESKFELVEGDPDLFVGTWKGEPTASGCVLTMDAEFDLGMPSLEHILDPIAVEAIEDAVESVLLKTFAGKVKVTFGERAAATAEIGSKSEGS